MKRIPLRRPNPYVEEPVYHRPAHNNSPYERTLQTMFESQLTTQTPPTRYKFCNLCVNKVLLSSSPHKKENTHPDSATSQCKFCAADICQNCTRSCEKCEDKLCYVCISTVFTEHLSQSLCPECKNS